MPERSIMSAKECIKKARFKLGRNQKEFAELLKLNKTVISMWETGARKPGFPKIRYIVDELKKHGINFEYSDFVDTNYK